MYTVGRWKIVSWQQGGCEQLPDSFSHWLMTGRGQAAEPLTVSRSPFAAALQSNTANSLLYSPKRVLVTAQEESKPDIRRIVLPCSPSLLLILLRSLFKLSKQIAVHGRDTHVHCHLVFLPLQHQTEPVSR